MFDSSEESVSNLTIKVYKQRWFFLFTFLFFLILQKIPKKSLGLVSNISVAYFNISYAQADWFVNGYAFGGLIAMPMFVWMLFIRKYNFRQFVLFGIGCSILSYILYFLGFLFPLYSLVFTGATIAGVAIQVANFFPSKLSALWFPESQIGLATAMFYFPSGLSEILACIILPNILLSPNKNCSSDAPKWSQGLSNENTTELSNGSKDLMEEDWFVFDKSVFIILFASCFCILCVIFILLMVFFPAHPKHPPSVAQASNRQRKLDQMKDNVTLKSLFNDLRAMIFDKHLFACSFAYCSLYSTFDIPVIFLQQLIKELWPVLSAKYQPDVLGSYILPFFSLGTIMGSLFAGKFIDRWKKYRTQSIAGSLLTFIFSVGYSVSLIEQILAVPIFFAFCGFSTRIGVIALYDAIMQHTYPIDPLFVSVWLLLLVDVFSLGVNELARLTYFLLGSTGLFVYQCSLFFIAFASSALAKPQLKRLNEENKNEEFQTESSNLISQ